MKLATSVKSVSEICSLNVSVALQKKFAAVAYLAEGQILGASENRVGFLILRDGTLSLILRVKKGKILILKKYE
jgi:hypothetical protein